MNLKPYLIKLNRIISRFGLETLRFLRSVHGFPAYEREYPEFRSRYRGQLNLNPCLHDRYAEDIAIKSEYFCKRLIVGRRILEPNPEWQVDMGSRIDGFVAHVASFREVEVFDVLPITVEILGVVFRQVDLMIDAEAAHRVPGGIAIRSPATMAWSILASAFN